MAVIINSKHNPNASDYLKSTTEAIGKGENVPSMADGDTYEAEARGNIKMASEQKGILQRDGAFARNSGFNKYKY